MTKKSFDKQQVIILLSSILLYGIIMVFGIINDSLNIKAVVIGLPVFLLAIYSSVSYPKIYLAALIALLPVSINMENTSFGFGISLPGELLVTLMAFLVLINLIRGKELDKAFFRHPVSIAIVINLLWMIVTSASSTMPLISLKHLVIRINFLLVFYYMIAQLFGTKKGVQQVFWLYGLSLLVVIFFILFKHSKFGFIQEVNHWAAKPFFKDHTIYGACVVMLLPFYISRFFIISKDLQFQKFLSFGMIPILLLAIFFSYSRAVWLSIGVISVVLIIIKFKTPPKHIVFGVLGILFALWLVRMPILSKMQAVDSQRGSDVKAHLSSTANIESNASNRERINRWTAGLDMFKEKPFFGFGPGIYPFQYAPYQHEEYLTYISTYDGDKGGVHSEYLKPLVESGVFGFLSFFAIIILVMYTGIRVIYNSQDKTIRLLAISLLLGLITYYFHGFVNNFLETDKVAVLFWGMAGLIVAFDIQEQKKTALLDSKI